MSQKVNIRSLENSYECFRISGVDVGLFQEIPTWQSILNDTLIFVDAVTIEPNDLLIIGGYFIITRPANCGGCTEPIHWNRRDYCPVRQQIVVLWMQSLGPKAANTPTRTMLPSSFAPISLAIPWAWKQVKHMATLITQTGYIMISGASRCQPNRYASRTATIVHWWLRSRPSSRFRNTRHLVQTKVGRHNLVPTYTSTRTSRWPIL